MHPSEIISYYIGTGDCQDMSQLPDQSVHCVITSPPYWGLRDNSLCTCVQPTRKQDGTGNPTTAGFNARYKGETPAPPVKRKPKPDCPFCHGTGHVIAMMQWEGGDPQCDHVSVRTSLKSGLRNDGREHQGLYEGEKAMLLGKPFKRTCGKCGATRVDSQLGMEETVEEYVTHLVERFREVKRVLRDDGTLWINLGDCHAGGGRAGRNPKHWAQHTEFGKPGNEATFGLPMNVPHGMKSKDLVGVPWLVAFALRADGWYLRMDNIWCLSGGTWLYVRTPKTEGPMMLKDLPRSKSISLWNGKQWTKVLNCVRILRRGDEIEVVLRSGERITCSPEHRFPTNRGILPARELIVTDVLKSTPLPDSREYAPPAIPPETAWFIGLYLAEGSHSGDTRGNKGCIQISGNLGEGDARYARLERIANYYGAVINRFVYGNQYEIKLNGKVIDAILDEYIGGRTARTKYLKPICWQHSNEWLRNLLDGYLGGDGHWEPEANRWRLGFTRNYSLERDLRILCARLGYYIRLKPHLATITGRQKKYPSFRGEIRFFQSGHHNCKDQNEIIKIRHARCRYLYDITVEDEPHLFALSSGILTHNSKPNCLPESCTDRTTSSHEYVFLFAKSGKPQYWVHPEFGATRKHPEPDYIYKNQQTGEKTRDAPADWESTTFETVHKRRDLLKGIIETRSKHKLWKRRNLWRGKDYFYDATAIREPIAGSTRERDKYTRITKGKDGPYSVQHDHETPSNPAGRNKRSVWWISPQPYEGAHFSTFPEAIPEIAIKAGTSAKGVCPECGAPWVRIENRVTEDEFGEVEFSDGRTTPQGTHKKKGGQYEAFLETHPPKTAGWSPSCECGADPAAIAQWRKSCGADTKGGYHGQATKDYDGAGVQNASAVKARILAGLGAKQTIGWAATCGHVREPIPALVLDNFAGSGTTLYVTLRLNRRGIAWELNPANVQLIHDRIKPFKNQARIDSFLKQEVESVCVTKGEREN